MAGTMKDSKSYETNMAMIGRRIDWGLSRLKEDYVLTEVDVGDLEEFTVSGRVHRVRQFEIDGVGNLLVMTNPLPGMMQMDTFTITPYYKNLPLFTTDYMYFETKRMFLNEIYSLVDFEDDLYRGYIGRFAENSKLTEHLTDMPMRECWYDDIRPVVVGKESAPEDDDLIFEQFKVNLETFIEMEKASPLLDEEAKRAKWERNYEYARRLVDDGGVSTELFVKSLGAERTKRFFYSVFFAPDRYQPGSEYGGPVAAATAQTSKTASEIIEKIEEFFAQKENGVSNLEKVQANQKVLRRLPETDESKSYDEAGSEDPAGARLPGVVIEDGKVIGLGIHIFNEDVYPIKFFEIYLRGCDLSGELDISGAGDMAFLDLYHNRISRICTEGLSSMRIFGVQDNLLTELDPSGMPVVQGIDAGMNRLGSIDVSGNPELVELYINDNQITAIDLAVNPKLKYLYCHNNRITSLDTRANPLVRHLNAAGNPMKEILALAPQREEPLPLELRAEEGGCVGLRFNPVYNAQWKETGEWQQMYFAYPGEGRTFDGWYDENGELFSRESEYEDEYGASRRLTAVFI